MKIGIDIDEVLAVLIPELTDFYNKRHGKNLRHVDQYTYRLEEFWNCEWEVANQVVLDFYDSKYFDQLKVVSGAKSAIKKLSKNYDLFAITSRPDFVGTRTRKWFDRNFPNLFKEIYFTNQHIPDGANKKLKSQVCIELGVNTMIDDNFDYALDCANNGIPVLMVDAPWNQGVILPENITRVKGWKEITKILIA